MTRRLVINLNIAMQPEKTQKTCRRAAVCPTLQLLLRHDQCLINSL